MCVYVFPLVLIMIIGESPEMRILTHFLCVQTTVEIPDICASFLASLKGERPTPDQFSLLMGDAMLVITAGRYVRLLLLSVTYHPRIDQLGQSTNETAL